MIFIAGYQYHVMYCTPSCYVQYSIEHYCNKIKKSKYIAILTVYQFTTLCINIANILLYQRRTCDPAKSRSVINIQAESEKETGLQNFKLRDFFNNYFKNKFLSVHRHKSPTVLSIHITHSSRQCSRNQIAFLRVPNHGLKELVQQGNSSPGTDAKVLLTLLPGQYNYRHCVV